jgi:hypothetical protein
MLFPVFLSFLFGSCTIFHAAGESTPHETLGLACLTVNDFHCDGRRRSTFGGLLHSVDLRVGKSLWSLSLLVLSVFFVTTPIYYIEKDVATEVN